MNNGKNKDGNQATKEMFKTQVDIEQENRVQVIDILNQTLADIFDLYSQSKQAHWNVKGENFYQFHLLFDQVAEMIFPYVDTVAERVMMLGGVAKGTARMSADNTRLEEFPQVHDGMACVEALVQRYGSLANNCREGIDQTEKLEDMASSDLMIEIVRVLDKALWFLEAHTQG